MELIQNFGIDPWLLGAQIVNFLVILYVLKRFAYKPLLTALKNREEKIQKGLEDAEEARKLLEKAADREQEILKKAQAEAKQLLSDAREQKEALLKASEEATKKQAEKMLKEAREQIAFETREAEKRLTAHVSELAMHFLQKSIEELFSENEQEVIMRTALKNMKSTKKN
jgi:F-type H+-transporting ATPase subunit b